MINFRFLLGLYSRTDTIEVHEAALIKEYNDLENFKNSEELQHFFELQKFIGSDEFKKKKLEIQSLDYKKTDAFLQEKEYQGLKKSARIRNYYSVLNSAHYKNYLEIKDSPSLVQYNELHAIVNSDAFKKNELAIRSLNYKQSNEYSKEQEFKKLRNLPGVKNYFKVISTEAYKLYHLLNDSADLLHYLELQKFAESEPVKSIQKRLKEEKFASTEAFQKLKKFELLQKSKHIKVYFKVLQSNAYKNFLLLQNSEEMKNFLSLEKQVTSEKFLTLKKDKKAFQNSEEQIQEKEYLKLKADKGISQYVNFLNSKLFREFSLIEKSGDIEKYEDLDKFVKSEEFITVKNYFSLTPQKRWEQREEYQNVSDFEKLRKDPRFITYFQFIHSKEFKLFNETINAGLIEKFEALQKFIESPEFHKSKEYLLLSAKQKWEQTPDFLQQQEYDKLASDKKIKEYLSFILSKEYKLYDAVVESGEIEKYEKLELAVTSEAFKENKAYMLLSFKQKWAKTEEFLAHNEFTKLEKSDKIIWYYKVVNSNKFNEIKKWNLTFQDDFTANQLNRDVWLTRFYYGDAFLKDTYSLSGDKHFITDGENISVENSILKILTRKEKAEGKAWNTMFGFAPKEFEYTSGLINTGKSFRQQYGRFRAKMKLDKNKGVTQAFWLVGGQIMPQIDILKCYDGNATFNNFWGNISEKDGVHRSSSKLNFQKLVSDFHIFELEWTPQELIWRINGLEVKREAKGIPDEPMYILLSSGIFSEVNGHSFPSTMQIDWVKCYKRAETSSNSKPLDI
jgi:beta-glucanase (GH16 family)